MTPGIRDIGELVDLWPELHDLEIKLGSPDDEVAAALGVLGQAMWLLRSGLNHGGVPSGPRRELYQAIRHELDRAEHAELYREAAE